MRCYPGLFGTDIICTLRAQAVPSIHICVFTSVVHCAGVMYTENIVTEVKECDRCWGGSITFAPPSVMANFGCDAYGRYYGDIVMMTT